MAETLQLSTATSSLPFYSSISSQNKVDGEGKVTANFIGTKQLEEKQIEKILQQRYDEEEVFFCCCRQETTAKITWTVADLFQCNDYLFLFYHRAGSAWDHFTPIGALFGYLSYLLPHYQPHPTFYQTIGNSIFVSGLYAMGVWIVLKFFFWDIVFNIIYLGIDVNEICRKLKENYHVRVMDQSVWIGGGLVSIALAIDGCLQPQFYIMEILDLSPGLPGVIQGICLGSLAGSILGYCRIFVMCLQKCLRRIADFISR